MINPLTKYEAWNLRREQRSLERWAQIRVEGKPRFVVTTALTYGLSVVGVTDVVYRILSVGEHAISRNIIFYVLGGIAVGFVGWSSMESKYQKALHKARRSKLSSGELPPRDYPLRITSD